MVVKKKRISDIDKNIDKNFEKNNFYQNSESFVKSKFYIFIGFVFFIMILFIVRLVFLQIINVDYYKILANQQYTSSESDIFDRGDIYFNKSNILNEYSAILAAGIKEEIIKNESINIIKRYRYYNFDEIGAKVLGFVGWNNDIRSGQYGIERTFDDILSRDKDAISKNFFLDLYESLYEYKNSDGIIKDFGDIYLTINSDSQIFLYNTLQDMQNKWQSEKVGGIIMNPNTGEIIAMEELSTFDPNNISETQDIQSFNNDLISGVFEMGSIIKPLTMLAAMDANVVNKDTMYTDTGFRELSGYKIYNFDKKSRGHIGMYPILADSLNVGIIFLVEKLGTSLFSEYFRKFGIGLETGISLPNEAQGLTNNLNSNIMVDAATAGFGQGIAITPIQTIRALSIIANGGKMINPYIVKKISYKNGYEKVFTPDDSVRVVSPESASIVKDYMVKIVDEKLSNGTHKDLKYSVAAKTGTAQMPQSGGGYFKDKYLHSFVGFFPANNPQFIIFLFHSNPKGAEYASQTLTEAFFSLKQYLINYYSILPDRG